MKMSREGKQMRTMIGKPDDDDNGYDDKKSVVGAGRKTIKDEARVDGSQGKRWREHYEEEAQEVDRWRDLWLITLNDRHKTFLNLDD